ncbi:hypothetical protein [Pantoea sp. 18069]|nr:hypothetical protein [Pantoea sp. 18069]
MAAPCKALTRETSGKLAPLHKSVPPVTKGLGEIGKALIAEGASASARG